MERGDREKGGNAFRSPPPFIHPPLTIHKHPYAHARVHPQVQGKGESVEWRRESQEDESEEDKGRGKGRGGHPQSPQAPRSSPTS